MADIVCLGELLIDFVPTVTGVGLEGAEVFRKAAGGAPANVAVGVARLGGTSAFMGKVGADGFGRFLADTLSAAGVDTGPLLFAAGAPTSLAFVSLAPDGDREFLFYRHTAADTLFAPEEVDEAAIRDCRVLHYGSISLITEPCRSATLHAIERARQFGVRRSYDPNLRLALWPDEAAARDGMLLGLRHAEIVKIGVEEVEFLTGETDVARGVRALWHDDLLLVAVTAGREGCVWFTREASGAVPGFVVAAVDTTGAGDAFMAGLLAEWVRTPDPLADAATVDRMCRVANAAGAVTTTSRGGDPVAAGSGGGGTVDGGLGRAHDPEGGAGVGGGGTGVGPGDRSHRGAAAGPLVEHEHAVVVLPEIDGGMAAAVGRVGVAVVAAERGDRGAGLKRGVALDGGTGIPGRGGAEGWVGGLDQSDALAGADGATDEAAEIGARAGRSRALGIIDGAAWRAGEREGLHGPQLGHHRHAEGRA